MGSGDAKGDDPSLPARLAHAAGMGGLDALLRLALCSGGLYPHDAGFALKQTEQQNQIWPFSLPCLLLFFPDTPKPCYCFAQSLSRALAALCPGAPITPPPGCVPEPQRYKPLMGVR